MCCFSEEIAIAAALALCCACSLAGGDAYAAAEPCGRAFVTFRLESASATVETLQFDVDYSSAGGGFRGSDASVECTSLAGGIHAANDDEGTKTLTLAHIFFSGAAAPLDLWRCSYATSGRLPQPSDFPIHITDATDPDSNDITVNVDVSDISCDPGCAAAPRTDCRLAPASVLLVKDEADDSRDKIAWKWKKGAAFDLAAISDPTAGGEYSLCVYPNSGALDQASYIGPSSQWRVREAVGYLFKDSSGEAGGVASVKIRTGSSASLVVSAAGDNLSDTLLPASSYVIQLLDRQKDACWSSTFPSGTSKPGQFKAKTPS